MRTTRPKLAALLSFIWPGLGQAGQGRLWRGAVQALPQLLALAVLLLALLMVGPLVLVAYLFNPVLSLGLFIALSLLGVWHAWSIVDAIGWRLGATSTRLWATSLVAVVFVVHAWLGSSLIAFYQSGTVIYQPPPTGISPSPGTSLAPGQTLPPGGPGQTDPPGPPLPGADDRVTVLLVGIDNTHGDALALTDTLIVASFDPRNGSLVMISLPRDTARLPMYSGGTFLPRVNQLRQSATRYPELYPDGPMGTLVNEMSYLIGVQIDYYAIIGIAGFAQLIDAVGGVDIVAEQSVDDPGYQFSPTEVGFFIDAGPHHLDGKYATAYARSRHGSSDYARARRQQQILLALRDRLRDPFVYMNIPGILNGVAAVVRTNAPLDRWPEIVQIAERSRDADTRHLVLSPPRYAGHVIGDLGPTSMTQLDMDAVAELSIELFGSDSRYAP